MKGKKSDQLAARFAFDHFLSGCHKVLNGFE
jgi:hypothetical protein